MKSIGAPELMVFLPVIHRRFWIATRPRRLTSGLTRLARSRLHPQKRGAPSQAGSESAKQDQVAAG